MSIVGKKLLQPGGIWRVNQTDIKYKIQIAALDDNISIRKSVKNYIVDSHFIE
ncbi:hypothetical protein KFK09_013805 [Dendrobium nobile]|uniref:Uncharacterized protein n=1 Tax=Dendrobium nobile TaxID=94219 RepID=A0A8T3B8G0_DENNO|nr:hypothetical protein KFK09_013805 [Dendrobium nobile]